MSRKAEKLLQKARQTRAGWSARDLLALYEGYGFVIREATGSHKIISHPELKHLRASVTDHPQELPKAYVSHAVKLIEELLAYQENSDNDE